jgi:hypothetical protein
MFQFLFVGCWAGAGAKKGPEKYFQVFPTTAKILFLRIFTFQVILRLFFSGKGIFQNFENKL